MPPRKRRFIAVCCDLEDVETKLERYYEDEYDLLAQSAYQVGIGFGAKVHVLLTFRLRLKKEEIRIENKVDIKHLNGKDSAAAAALA